MTLHLSREIEKLKKRLLSLSAFVEETVHLAVKAVLDLDPGLAEKALTQDEQIDQKEVEIEEDCLKILALHQPVAYDLRFVVACMKINNDLERIGDLARNIAERALEGGFGEKDLAGFELESMVEKTTKMLNDCLDALMNGDIGLSRQVCRSDDEVDELNRRAYVEVQRQVTRDTSKLPGMVRLLSVSRNLERIADSATNIAEDTIYLLEGRIVRHGFSRPADRK
jgi:phosphate transport system protein